MVSQARTLVRHIGGIVRRIYTGLLALVVSASAVGLLAANPQDYIDSGRKFENEMRWGEAMAEYHWILTEIDPNHVEAHYRLGVVREKVGAIEDAIQSYTTVLQLNPSHPGARSFLEGYYVNEGIAFRREQKFDKAKAAFQQALSINGSSAAAHFELGQELARQGQLDQAIQEYQESIRLDPDKSTAHTRLAAAYTEKGQYEQAIQAYQEVIKQHPRDPAAHDGLGVAYSKTGQPEKAIETLGQAVRFYLVRGEREQARPAYELQKKLLAEKNSGQKQ